MTDLDDLYLTLDNLRRLVEERLPVVDPDSEPPKRRTVRKDDVLAALLAAQTRTGPEHSSVTLKTNAKGEPQLEITVRSGESDRVETAADALAEAHRLWVNARELLALSGTPLAGAGAPESVGQA